MAETKARIWYQSFVHPTEQAPYVQRLQALLDGEANRGAPAGATAANAVGVFKLRV